jgi:GT2 family glycosyltransferase
MTIFSVIIPTYNRAEVLRKCLDCLKAQQFQLENFEVFVCDDGSTDGTGSVVKNYNAPYRLVYLKQINKGPAAARNMGIKRAVGEYLLILNDDALLEPDALSIHYELQKNYTAEKVAVLGKFSLLPEYRKDPFGYLLENSDFLFYYHRMKRLHQYNYEMFYTCNISIKRQAVLDAGMFDEDFTGPAGEDLELGYRLEKMGYKVLYEPGCVAWHDHKLTPRTFCKTYITRGNGAATLYSKYPELNIFNNYTKPMYKSLLQYLRRGEEKVKPTLKRIFEINESIGPEPVESQIKKAAQAMEKLLLGVQNYFYLTGCVQNPLFERLLPHVNNAVKNPLISIILLNLNGADHIKNCIHSIQYFSTVPYELIVVDNGSTDGSKEYLRSIPEIILIENDSNVGAPYGRNQGLAVARGEYIIFVDNDTIVTEGWLEKFLDHASKNPEIGMLGPMSNYVSGSQFVKQAFYKNTRELHLFAKRWEERNRHRIQPTGRLILFCLFVRRKVIEKIGGVDPAYDKWGWEDDDLSVRSQIAGFKLGIAKDIFIHHTGSQTAKTAHINYRELSSQNWKVFAEKFGIRQNANSEMKYDSAIFEIPFQPGKHFVPLPEKQEIERLLYLPQVTKSFEPYRQEPSNLISDLIERAGVQEKNGEFEAAADTMAEMLAITDDTALRRFDLSEPDLLLLTANYYLKSERIAKAKEYFELALRANPESAEACFGLARCFESLGKREGAKEMYGWAYKLKPEWNEAKQIFSEFITQGKE